ncbi:NAD-dependent epimerase/dehydratase family protein [Myxococcota bacterium]|nr:NAD-dependent epimerase/dehydratase family protein [Myxococcota bacterium]MBU1538026.1 NAD-dependent epimerase/dehydratase family protein [Myxococcota bacterium]
MKICITGGAGFLGLHLTKHLHSLGHSLTLLDIDDYVTSEYPPDNVTFIGGDVRNMADMERALDGADAVIHAAAALPLWSKEEIYSTNIFGTKTVLEAAMAAQISRVAYVSSTAVYGVPQVHPLMEYFPMVGVGPYGESKILAEKVCGDFREKGMVVGVIRPKTFIGPYRLGVFQILFEWINEGHRIPLIGSGHNRYQLLDVQDLCVAFEKMITSKDEAAAANTYNIGAASFGTVREDVSALCEHAGSGSKILPVPAGLVIPTLKLFEKLHLSPLYEWIYGTAHRDSFVSVEKASRLLGFSPVQSNAQALIRSYDWYMENKDTMASGTGITHRVPWDQGILKLFKKVL